MNRRRQKKLSKNTPAPTPTAAPAPKEYIDQSVQSGVVERTHKDGRVTLIVAHWSLVRKVRKFIGPDTFEGMRKKRHFSDEAEKGHLGEILLDDLLHDQTSILLAMLADDSYGQALGEYLARKWDAKFPGRREEILAAGRARFVDLPVLFPPGSPIVVRDPTDSQRDLGAEVVRVTFNEWTGKFCFEVRFVEGLKGNAIYAQKQVRVRYFDDLLAFRDMDVYPLDDKTRQRLAKRGGTFLSLLLKEGAHYANYQGNLVLNFGWGERLVRADGRCMIDPAGFIRFDETQNSASQSQYSNRWWEFADSSSDDNGAGAGRCVLTEDLLWMTSPTVAGYSLTAKRWGKFLLAGVSEIEFRDDAIDALVLDERKKSLIIALVRHNDDKLRFRDVIEGKGGGTIFLLHGTPGTGKTLTAEAVAEALHQPLYSVSIGELGTDPEQLEAKLTEILELAAMWRAVLLLDEADIFLEKRNNDIDRNAMVGVFLRLLEYHNGVLMLTTNRVQEFDAAFHSRISLAIKYPKMSAETRHAVWTRLLTAAGFGHIDASALSHLEINGREVKNLIRIASISAKEEGAPMEVRHLLECHTLQKEFLADATAS